MTVHTHDLIAALSQASAYEADGEVEVHQTHISAVFVIGDRAYKLKKAVDFGFVDYSTPARRRALCEAEVRLNRRLAPGVYLGVRSVHLHDGVARLGDPDDPDAVDWVVEMTRLDDADNFLAHLHAGTLREDWLAELGRQMAEFHLRCERGVPGGYGSFETVARNARENFEQATQQVGATVAESVFRAAREATDAWLERLEPEIRRRDESGCTRDTHGDLRLEHVYRSDGELVVVDCIEFNDAFRYSDPVADVAFLVMDLRIRWHAALARTFTAAYFAASPGGESLLNFYVAYRSAVRAKVHGLAAIDPDVDQATRARATAKSRAHWLFAWSTLAPPRKRPALVLVGGLPASGKSTLARALAAAADLEVIDSDHVRKELAGVAAEHSMRGELDAGIYTADWTRRTYQACLDRSMTAVTEGRRVIVAATFRDESWRRRFLAEAHAAGVCALMLECHVPREEAVRRLEARHDDASDADLAVYDHVAASWETPGEMVRRRLTRIDAADAAMALLGARRVLGQAGLDQG